MSELRSLARRDMPILSTSAGILEDSLFHGSGSVESLIMALGTLCPPGDTETMQDVIRALGELNDGRATGTIGIASAWRDTEGFPFFNTHLPQPHLDGRYTVFGKVVTEMEVVDRLQVDNRIEEIRVIR